MFADEGLEALEGLFNPPGIQPSPLPHRPPATTLTPGDGVEGLHQGACRKPVCEGCRHLDRQAPPANHDRDGAAIRALESVIGKAE
jgi:hypothetical protein